MPPFGKALERIELEADPRHAELLIPNSVLQSNSKGVNTPGERQKDSVSTVPLSPQDATSFRSNVMRLAYLAGDRIELQFLSKELARAMAGPATADVEALKRCIRFLLKYPRKSLVSVTQTSLVDCTAAKAQVLATCSMGDIC